MVPLLSHTFSMCKFKTFCLIKYARSKQKWTTTTSMFPNPTWKITVGRFQPLGIQRNWWAPSQPRSQLAWNQAISWWNCGNPTSKLCKKQWMYLLRGISQEISLNQIKNNGIKREHHLWEHWLSSWIVCRPLYKTNPNAHFFSVSRVYSYIVFTGLCKSKLFGIHLYRTIRSSFEGIGGVWSNLFPRSFARRSSSSAPLGPAVWETYPESLNTTALAWNPPANEWLKTRKHKNSRVHHNGERCVYRTY